MRELIIDDFAGGGGASIGIKMATGRSPDIAINHDDVALGMHAANHPETRHISQNIWKVDPDQFDGPIGLAWFSPDCKHFSKAKGGRPVEQNIRNLAWVVIRWAKRCKGAPRIIILENVEEFATWGPLAANGRPCPERMGITFKRFVRELRRLGYAVEWRALVAADYGAPTIRRRLFLIARRDGLPIVWPKPTHGKPDRPAVLAGKLKPWVAAASIIDWSLPCPSIFETAEEIMAKHGLKVIRPLAENTMARIARGVKRYVLDTAAPFVVPITHTGDHRTYGIGEPLRTVTTAHRGEHALIAPVVVKNYYGDKPHYPVTEPTRTILTGQHHMLVTPVLCSHYGEGDGGLMRSASPDEPLRTVTASPRHSVVAATLINTRNGERRGQEPRCRDIERPYPTVTADGSQGAIVAAFLAQHNTDMVGHDAREPVSTIVQKGCTQAVVSAGLVNLKGSDRRQSAPEAPCPTQTAGGWHIAEVRAFLMKYYGPSIGQVIGDPLHTATAKARFGVVTVMIGGEPFAIVDIGMRMLTPRELFCANGAPRDYIIDKQADGTPITKTDQIRMCGNMVCPDVACALISANYAELPVSERGIPEFALQAAE